MNQQAMITANKATNAFIARQRFSAWQLVNETAVRNQVDAFWSSVYEEERLAFALKLADEVIGEVN